MIPATCGSASRSRRAAATSASVASAGELDEPVLDADEAATVEDLVEVDRGRRVLADDEHRQGRGEAVLGAEAADIGGDLLPDRRRRSGRRAGALRSFFRHRAVTRSAFERVTGAAAADDLTGVVRQPPDIVHELLGPAEEVSLGIRVADGRQVDVHVRRRGSRGRDRHQARHLEVRGRVLVAPSGQGLGEDDHLVAGLHDPERDIGGTFGGLPDRRRAHFLLLVGVAGHLEGLPVDGERRGILVCEGQQAVCQLPPGGAGFGEEGCVIRVLRATLGQGRDHRDQCCPKAPGDRGGTAASGGGLARGEPVDKRRDRQVAEAVMWFHTADCREAGPLRGGPSGRFLTGRPAHSLLGQRGTTTRPPAADPTADGEEPRPRVWWTPSGGAVRGRPPVDRPAPGAVLERQGETQVRGVHLEHRARPGDGRVGTAAHRERRRGG